MKPQTQLRMLEAARMVVDDVMAVLAIPGLDAHAADQLLRGARSITLNVSEVWGAGPAGTGRAS